jgi:hypothetical protein
MFLNITELHVGYRVIILCDNYRFSLPAATSSLVSAVSELR